MKKGIIIAVILCSFLISDKIKAITYTTEVQVKSSSYFDIRNASSFTCNTWDSCEWELVSSDSNPIQSKQIQINSNYNTKDKDFVAFQILVSQPVQITNVENGIQIYCTNWTQSGNSYYCSNVSTASTGTPIIQESILGDINFNIKANYTNNTSAFCDINGNQIICPTFKNQIDNVEITWNFKTHYTSYALFRFYKIANNIYYSNPTNAIESQTQTIMNGNTTYDQNATQDYTNQTNEINNITMAEDQLLNNLDFNTTDMNITINPNASLFIWNIVNGLRSMNGAIVLLMTSLLSMGIIKLVLGR